MDAKRVGERIAGYRKQKGLTQQQLADMLAVTNKAVSKWETGEGFPDITSLPALAQALGVRADDILGDGPQNEKEERAARLMPAVKPAMAIYAILIIVLSIVIYNPALGWPASYIDPAALLLTFAIGLPAAYLVMWMRKSKDYLSHLILFGLPIGSTASFLSAMLHMVFVTGEWTQYYFIALIPFLYAAFFSILFFIIFQAVAAGRRKKRPVA